MGLQGVTYRLWWFGWTPQFFGFTCVVELQLDLSSVTARLRGSSCVVLFGLDTGVMNQNNIFCKGSVDTTILGVDKMVQNKGRNVKKSPSQVDTSPEQVDTEPSQVDTRDLSQGSFLQVWDSVSTHLLGRSTHSGISVT
ncbi:hypothetical protein Taro_020149 [Colocasia esculenta]|uniref:Uncharacterized protein n=1 Tax=Colocasia esculenta TaxID=4460 RepID=A0A843UVQ0_COLES|nr:hypothetical protein [Colocasia esculenta]